MKLNRLNHQLKINLMNYVREIFKNLIVHYHSLVIIKIILNNFLTKYYLY